MTREEERIEELEDAVQRCIDILDPPDNPPDTEREMKCLAILVHTQDAYPMKELESMSEEEIRDLIKD